MPILKQIKRALDYVFALIMTGISYPLGRLLYRNKGIWLVGERPHQAQDNGYIFFKYLREKHPERRAYYVIKKNSHHIKRITDIGDVVYYGSLKHWLMYFGCEAVISAHIRSLLPSNNWRYKELASHHKQKNKKQIFLQHGVISADIPSLYQEHTLIDLFICGAKPEFHYVRNCFHYHDNAVQYTGLARYDSLYDIKVKKKQILIMPTWRTWLVKPGCDVANSQFMTEWNKVITDKKLIEAVKNAGYKIVFYPHSELQFAAHLFQADGDTVTVLRETEGDVRTLLRESALLITDFSSVFFDFAYMRKPALYFAFDRERHSAEHYHKSYFDYKKHGFGKVADTAPELIANVIKELETGVVLTEKYSDRINRFFPYHDRKNCERIYHEIEKLMKRSAEHSRDKKEKSSKKRSANH